MNNTCYAVVVAAGSGIRAGTGNKLLLPLHGKPVLYYSLRALEDSSRIQGIILVCQPHQEQEYRKLVSCYGFTKVIRFVCGGDTRTKSVYNGLCALPDDCETVLIQDGARPLLSAKLIKDCLSSVDEFGSGVAAGPVIDTVKETDREEMVLSTPDRSTSGLAAAASASSSPM